MLVIIQTIVFFMLFVLLLLPGIIASRREHHNRMAIWAVTLIFGWTILGWGIALVWALSDPPPYSNRRP